MRETQSNQERPQRMRFGMAAGLSVTAFLALVFVVACGKSAHQEPPPESAYSFGQSNVFDDGTRRVNLAASGDGLVANWEELNSGCIACHPGTGDPHVWRDEEGEEHGAVRMGCVDCHGGNGQANTIEEAHPKASFPEKWPTAANPERTYMLNQDENWDWIRFVNPGDLRVAQTTCGACHTDLVLNVKKGVMSTASHFGSVAAYANGIVSVKRGAFGEAFGPDGKPEMVKTFVQDTDSGEWRAPTDEECRDHGWTPLILPYPHWEITQVGNVYRVFEQGSRLGGPALAFNGLPLILPGLPDRFEDPGRPNNKLSDRGSGTSNRVDLPILNVHKTRLNDPHLTMFGTNDNPGDYRSSGCSACHVVYANDRSPIHSGPYAKYGNMGKTDPNNPDPTLSKSESGHPLRHQFTEAIPSSQCMVCHMHQPNSFVNSYYGMQMWTYETDGEDMWPKEQAYPGHKEFVSKLDRNPEEAATRGLWGEQDFLKDVALKQNPKMKHTQFADYHGHGWMFRGVFKMDRKGNLLDKGGAVINYDDPDKFKGVVPIKGSNDPHFDPEMAKAGRRAVHLKDIHAEVGMHCVDCHFTYGVHGTGHVYSEYQGAVQIGCKDCHGTVTEFADFDAGVSGPVADAQKAFNQEPEKLSTLKTPWGESQFEWVERNGKEVAIQRSMVHKNKTWEISMVRDSVDRQTDQYSDASAYAHTIEKDNTTWHDNPDNINVADMAHADSRMECYACHTSWITACFGCHLPQRANMYTENHRFERKYLRNYASYNPQVARDADFLLGKAGFVKGGKIAPVRSSSAVMISSQDSQRRIIYGQLMTMAANGMSSQLFNTHFPHTVRKTETRKCDDCHVGQGNDNNAWLASTYMLGTNYVNFMGRNTFVGLGESGFDTVRVGEWIEPQAVIGSNLHRMAFPDDYQAHLDRGKELAHASHHGRSNVYESQLRGEYLYTVGGPDGFRAFDVANRDNKDFSQKVVTAPVSPLGQDTHVSLPNATSFVLPFNNNISMSRLYRPENFETPVEYKGEKQNLHEAYRYAFVTDSELGLVVIDIDTLTDGDPMNNFFKEVLRWNPDGLLNGARQIEFAGKTLYIAGDNGLVAVDIDDPLAPKVIAKIPSIKDATSIRIQFRYLFITDAQGLKVVDATVPSQMKQVGSTVKIGDARDVWVARTWAYVSAGAEGIVIVDVEKPEAPRVVQVWNGDGHLVDTNQVKTGMTNDSLYAYIADGRGGMKVAQLVTPEDGGRSAYGFSPQPKPKLISWYNTSGPALCLSEALDRDRAVDESGSQVTVFGRIGGRPMNLKEMQKLFFKNGQVWRVSNSPKPSGRRSGR